MASVQIRGLRKHFGSRPALNSVDVDVRDGEFFCLLGPPGAGKTTLLRCLVGLEQPDAGEIALNGQSVSHLSASERNIAMVFQSYALYPHLTVRENLAYPLRERKTDEEEIRRRIGRVAETLRITHTLDRPPQTLSGGEMQRVAIGRAIVREAEVYLFDEPLSNLDAQLRQEMRAELKRLHQELGATLIYATPDQLDAMTMPERVAVLRDGVVLQCDAPETLYFAPTHAFVAAYVGDPPMNLFPAEATETGHLRTPWFEFFAPRSGLRKGRYLLGIRPEDLRFCPADSAEGVTFPVRVYAVESCGDYRLLTLTVGESQMKCLMTDETFSVEQGAALNVSLALDRLYVIDPETEQVVRDGHSPTERSRRAQT